MSKWRMYIDESGDHDMRRRSPEDPQRRFLSLVGVWISETELLSRIRPAMEELKRRYFRYDPDEKLILHRKDIQAQRGKFAVLRDPEIRGKFDRDLLDCLTRWSFRYAAVVLDKKTHADATHRRHRHAYHYCLHVLIERYRGDFSDLKRALNFLCLSDSLSP